MSRSPNDSYFQALATGGFKLKPRVLGMADSYLADRSYIELARIDRPWGNKYAMPALGVIENVLRLEQHRKLISRGLPKEALNDS